MVPLEINSAGRPVIAYKAGGALDTVVEGVTGLFFTEPTAASLAEAIEGLESRPWDPVAIRRHAEGFDIKVFKQKFLTLISSFVPVPSLEPISAVATETSLCSPATDIPCREQVEVYP